MKKQISENDLYDSRSNLAFMVDFGEHHPAFKDSTGQVILEDNENHMELIHDVYGG